MSLSHSPGPTLGIGPPCSAGSLPTGGVAAAAGPQLNGGPPASDQLLLSLRNRPHCRVFRALFQYLPLRDSPNDNPQLELALAPGDVVLVKGEMDSDGFFKGETLDGRTGLVPSNYVERVPDHLILQNARAPSPSYPLSVPTHLTNISHDFSEVDNSLLPDSVCPFPPADVSKVTVQEIKQTDTPRVPCPRELVVEKKLSRSLVIAWSPPEESFIAVSQYHVCVDSNVRAVVPGSYKCRALIEDVSLDGSVNVSVRAVTDQGHSPDQACSVAVGTRCEVAPQHLRVWQVTPISACVRWHPSNSNAEHVVSLNAVKVGVCPATVFQVQLQGLTPSTIYRISIRTKHPRAVLEQRPVERCLDFKTLPKIGLPDPPTNVQVENGPQPGHLLVSWTPVANQPKPPSRAAVAAYLVYADGKNIAQVPQDTADHVVLRLADLSDDPPIFLTVRTKTREGAVSSDSNVARVPRGGATHYEPLLTTVGDPMVSSYPNYTAQPSFQQPYAAPLSGPLSGPLAVGTHSAAVAAAAPYTAPPMLNQLPFQSNPLTSYTASAVQGYNMYDRMGTLQMTNTVPQQSMNAMGQPLMSAPMPMQSGPMTMQTAVLGPSTLAATLPTPAHQSNMHGTLPKQWKSAQMSQYYTFHPQLLRADGTAEDARPSVLEMENSYLLRHRQPEWSGADARTRMQMYGRQGTRAGSAEDRTTTRQRLVPPRLARVKSESGFGTRSEPDLRPPTLDDDCRWFVALFDYSHHMSPNANAEVEELSFRKHQLIKVYGEADPDGFFHGQIGSRYGLVPSNMVIEIAKDDLLPKRTRLDRVAGAAPEPVAGAEPALRRMRWGSLKSRSYDHAGDRRSHERPQPSNYASLDRREMDRRGGEGRDRHRRTNGRDYEHRRDYDERYREGSRDRRDEYYRDREDEEYREKYRDRYEREYERRDDRREERRDERRDERREERRDYERRGHDYGRDDERHRRDRREDGYREERGHEQHPQTSARYDQQASGAPPLLQHGSSGQLGHGSGHQMGQLGQQMGQMQVSSMLPTTAPPQMGQMGSSLGQLAQMGQMSQMGQSMNVQGMPGPLLNDTGMNGMSQRKMVAKFDYDSRQLSPNVDAEQVELSFRQGDIITVFGEMDEDGFYMGELGGVKGLVPSNFLQSSPLNQLGPAQPSEPMIRKGVAFSDGQPPVRKTAPVRQSSQTSASSAAPAGKPTVKKSTAGQPGKTLAKKTSDVGKNPNVRKTSTAVKKSDSSVKKK